MDLYSALEYCDSPQSKMHQVHTTRTFPGTRSASCGVRRPDALGLFGPDWISQHFSRTLKQIDAHPQPIQAARCNPPKRFWQIT
jgi:hypothetical protein